MITTDVTHLVEGQRIVLEARTFRLRLPLGGVAWSRPVAARVGAPGGEIRLPIRDVTRRWQIVAYGFSTVCLLLGLAARRPN
jgi:hypothetical protein